METTEFLAGQLLLALPGIGDPRFERAVIAMCGHDEKGALGIGIGHLVEGLGFHDLLAQLDIAPGVAPNVPIHHGGPVEPGRGFVLHSPDWRSEGSLMVGDSWGLTSTLDILRAIAAGEGPKRWLVAAGYAGWSPGQLDEEMAGAAWFPVPGRDDLLFDVATADRWTSAYAAAGIDVRLLSGDMGTA